MNRVAAVVLIGIAALGTDADAQVRRQQVSQGPPAYWGSIGVGAFSANSVTDGDSQTTWNFGNATSPQYRASLERNFSNGIALGLAGTYVKAPIRHTSSAGSFDADVNVYSLGVNFESAGAVGFHQVYGGSLGMTRYDGFNRKSDGAELAPAKAVNAISGSFSYGFGYGFSQRTAIVGVYDIGLVYHNRDGLTSDQRNTLVPRTLRVGLRQGFGFRAQRGGVRRRR